MKFTCRLWGLVGIILMCLISWQSKNFCWLDLAFIIGWRVVPRLLYCQSQKDVLLLPLVLGQKVFSGEIENKTKIAWHSDPTRQMTARFDLEVWAEPFRGSGSCRRTLGQRLNKTTLLKTHTSWHRKKSSTNTGNLWWVHEALMNLTKWRSLTDNVFVPGHHSADFQSNAAVDVLHDHLYSLLHNHSSKLWVQRRSGLSSWWTSSLETDLTLLSSNSKL